MVKRYPHTAIVTFEIDGKLVDGEWQRGKSGTISIIGRYDPVSDGRIIKKSNALGDEKQVHGYFYTKARPDIDTKYIRIHVPAFGINVEIICWEPYQSHSVICV